MSAASSPSSIGVIGLQAEQYDDLKRRVRVNRHTKRRPLRFQFAGDEFKTLIWIEGDTMFGRDPEYPEGREIHIIHLQDYGSSDATSMSAKGLLMVAFCQTFGEEKLKRVLPALLEEKKLLCLLSDVMDQVKETDDATTKNRSKVYVILELARIGATLIDCSTTTFDEALAEKYFKKIISLAEQMMA